MGPQMYVIVINIPVAYHEPRLMINPILSPL